MEKHKRKICLINKPLQLKYASMVAAVLTVYSAVIGYFIKVILNSAIKGAQALASVDPQELLVMQQQNDKMFLAIVIALALNTLLVGLFWLIAMHKIAGPLYRLNKGLQEIAAGRLPDDIHLRKGDELSEIVNNFNKMVSSLRSAPQKDKKISG
jgi:nitrogen fixation/metabolism regulation signal transduction histidine kinase